MTQLETGAQAPDFALLNANDEEVALKDFAGKKVILYAYPAALTPGCTIEAIDFSAALGVFAQAGYSILGISPDSPVTLTSFTERNNLAITLLADPTRETLTAYGAWGDRELWGKVLPGVIRSTFVIEVDDTGEGKILSAEYGVRAKGHVQRLRDSLGI